MSDPMQNDISKHCTKFQRCSSKITKVTKSQSFHKCGTNDDIDNEHQRHQSGKTYSLVEMKFRRDKKKSSGTNTSLEANTGGWEQTQLIISQQSCLRTNTVDGEPTELFDNQQFL